MDYSIEYDFDVNQETVNIELDFVANPVEHDGETRFVFDDFRIYLQGGESIIEFDLLDDNDPITTLLRHMGLYDDLLERVYNTPDPVDFGD